MASPFQGPVLALVMLTMCVLGIALIRRIAEIRARCVPLQSLARASDVMAVLSDSAAMDNFNNLLQLPVLFYVLCLALVQAGERGDVMLIGAWCYVLLRVAHSAIQLRGNRVRQRFGVWALSNLVLLGLWVAFSVQLVQSGNQGRS